MIILGIDTSCDDTAISVMEIRNPKHEIRNKLKLPNFEIISNVVSSQVKLHAKYGGVYPSLAKREHIKNLPLVHKKATKEARTTKVDYVAVTVGPGLEPCLWQGLNFAEALAEKWKKPLIPVNHIEAHIIANWLTPIRLKPKAQNPRPKRARLAQSDWAAKSKTIFPAVCLIVSGGHTQLILMKGIGKYQLIGETRDDAAGECFDKTARILGLGYPGGPVISQLAAKWKYRNIEISKYRNITLPRPMMYTKDYDFSFSGLKTAVLYKVKELKPKTHNLKAAFCAEIQQSIIDVLIWKTLKAAKDFNAKSIILGGGVSANEELRKQIKLKIKNQKLKINFFVPEKNLCTDNAAMVAATAYLHQKEAVKNFQKIKADGNLKIC